jgi:sugar lactone lactonase YvrE
MHLYQISLLLGIFTNFIGAEYLFRRQIPGNTTANERLGREGELFRANSHEKNPYIEGQATVAETVIVAGLLSSGSPNLFMKLLAGTNTRGNSGDGGQATSAGIWPRIPYVDSGGNIYIPDYGNKIIRKVVTSTGIISKFGGSGSLTNDGNSAAILSVNFLNPYCVVGDASRSVLYISDMWYIWKYTFTGNSASVYAGTNEQGFLGESTPATLAKIFRPLGMWLTTAGDLYFADAVNQRIRKIVRDAQNLNIISTVAGTGTGGYAGDSGKATSAQLQNPYGVFVDTTGKVFIADTSNNRIRVIDNNAIITTFAGNGQPAAFMGATIPGAMSAGINFPTDVKGDSLGNIYIAASYAVYMVTPGSTTNTLSTLFGKPRTNGFVAGNAPARFPIGNVTGLWIDSDLTVYFSDESSIHRSFFVKSPTSQPSRQPAADPTVQPTSHPSTQPSTQPAAKPSIQPSSEPTGQPTRQPTSQPTSEPTFQPSTQRSRQPTIQPSSQPTSQPSAQPSRQPAGQPSGQPSKEPTGQPTSQPSRQPNGDPSGQPTIQPSSQPSFQPSAQPSRQPIGQPSGQPSKEPTTHPTSQPSRQPNTQPSCSPSRQPSSQPTSQPNGKPSSQPTSQPVAQPTRQPTGQPTRQPTRQPTNQPGSRPSRQPSSQPTARPSRQPTRQPTRQPSGQPTNVPTTRPSPQMYSNLFMKLVAGQDVKGNTGDTQQATSVTITCMIPWVDTSGNIYLPDNENRLVRKVAPTGIITTVIAVNFAYLNNPYSIVGDTAGTVLYISDLAYVWKYVLATGTLTKFVGAYLGFSGDNGDPVSAKTKDTKGLWLTTAGVLYIADSGNHRIRKVTAGSSTTITTVAGTGIGSYSGDTGQATASTLNNPSGVYMDSGGKLFIADTENHRIRLVNTLHIITTFACSGILEPFNGDFRKATSASLNRPYDVKGDRNGNIYIADFGNFIIRKVDKNGIIMTLFGTPGQNGFTSADSADRSALIHNPVGLWLDTLSRIYFSDLNSIHRSLNLAPTSQPTGQPSSRPTGSFPDNYPNLFMELIGGKNMSAYTAGYSGDNGPAKLAKMSPGKPWVDFNGSVYFADYAGCRIRKINRAGIITSFAGSGRCVSTGRSAPATSVNFTHPRSIVGDKMGKVLYISDYRYIWKYQLSNNMVSVFAGKQTPGASGDNGPATSAQLTDPLGLWLTTSGILYFADGDNNKVRKIVNGTISNVAGNGTAGFPETVVPPHLLN